MPARAPVRINYAAGRNSLTTIGVSVLPMTSMRGVLFPILATCLRLRGRGVESDEVALKRG